jgi:hypothetical protein
VNIGIVVEGDTDAEAYPQLIRKIRPDIEEILPISCRGASTLKREFVKWLKYFNWYAPHSIDSALVIMDSDCSDASSWETQLKEIYEHSHFEPSFPVHFHATKCELETWLLADENAINQVSQMRGKKKKIGAVTIQFERYRNAKELFQKELWKLGLPVTARVYQEIAIAADVERIAARCPHFSQFVDKVRAS